MITIVAKGVVKEENINKFKEYAQTLVEETRKEKGCISYNLYEDINDPKIITFIEEWEDQEAIDAHVKASHFVEIVPKLRDLQESETEVNLYKRV
ncbi:MAG: antibiotic biosynthesis monooxygenase [Anaeromicrobium sp.]|jgi:quinol monooxygenase YgiN|uniref:putative quinol monooxygenase n=1 Tax=Anaeromicrobium sp. TaxID=1929132 RepID=UPI0025EC6F86|nr:putative quinol monooxygenase [Anaeromicrobium sp.]MCT4596095.1 antibiotic biosynthesis monooxygenase [Anaeromicrobium sp.]